MATASLAGRLLGYASFVLIACPQLTVIVLLLLVMPHTWDWRAPVIMLAGVALVTWLILGGGLWLARGLGCVHRASPRLAELVERTASRVGIRPRAAWETDLGFANAFALPPTQSLLIARSLLDRLNDEEMIALLAHELAHLGEPRAVTLVRVSSVYLMLPLGATGLIVNYYGLAAPPVLALALFLGMLLVVRLSRRMELEADRVGQAHELSPGDYARALERIHEVEWLPAVMPGSGQSHPHLYDRLIAAGVEPAYPRPDPPSRWRGMLGTITTLLTMMSGMLALDVGLQLARERSEIAILGRIAVTGGSAHSLSDLALFHYRRGEYDQAVILYQAASEVDATSTRHACNLAIVLAHLDRCAEAETVLRDASFRLAHDDRVGASRFYLMAQDTVRQCRQRQDD
jgi:Zn-dependent protease with chaperone function